ncbi:MAG: EscF/YscF/HrpA family type III secretion system needle major subunit [Verrucomicrobiota bacterium]
MALDLTKVYDTMLNNVSQADANVAQAAEDVNPDDQLTMVNLQQKMQQWTLATQMQSNTIKTVSEGIKSTVANIR